MPLWNPWSTCLRYEVASLCLKIFVWFQSRLTCRNKFIREGKRRRADPNLSAEAKQWARSGVVQLFSESSLLWSACASNNRCFIIWNTNALRFMTIRIYFFDPVLMASTVTWILHKFKSHDLYKLGLQRKATENRLERSDLFIYTTLKLDLWCSNLTALTVWLLSLGVLIVSSAQKHLFPPICVSVMGNGKSLFDLCLSGTHTLILKDANTQSPASD